MSQAKLLTVPAKKRLAKAAPVETDAMKLRRASLMLDKLLKDAKDLSVRAAETRARLS